MRRFAGAAGGDHGDGNRFRDGGGELAVKSLASTVAIHRSQQDFSGATTFGFARPVDSLLAGWRASAGNVDFGGIWRLLAAARINGDDNSLRAEASGNLSNQA